MPKCTLLLRCHGDDQPDSCEPWCALSCVNSLPLGRSLPPSHNLVEDASLFCVKHFRILSSTSFCLAWLSSQGFAALADISNRSMDVGQFLTFSPHEGESESWKRCPRPLRCELQLRGSGHSSLMLSSLALANAVGNEEEDSWSWVSIKPRTSFA